MTLGIDLNADMGETFGAWGVGDDARLMPLLSSANLACGFHAGDPLTMQRSVALALEHGVSIGAHPGFPDLVGFGRRDLAATPDEVYTDVLYQLGALYAFVRAQSGTLHHIKAHGALYLRMLRDASLSDAVARAVYDFDAGLPLVVLAGPGGKVMRRAAAMVGVRVVLEAFPDRAYMADGTLAPRALEGAVHHDAREIAQRAVQMACEGTVTAVTGETIPLQADTLCLHGDNPAALDAAHAVRTALNDAGVAVRTF